MSFSEPLNSRVYPLNASNASSLLGNSNNINTNNINNNLNNSNNNRNIYTENDKPISVISSLFPFRSNDSSLNTAFGDDPVAGNYSSLPTNMF